MIAFQDSYILLSTSHTSLLLSIDKVGKVNVAHYGRKLLSLQEAKALTRQYAYIQGCETTYSDEDAAISLNHNKLLVSSLGKGDYFSPSVSLKRNDNSVFDFVFESFQEKDTADDIPLMITPHGVDSEAVLTLKETKLEIYLRVHFFLYEDTDVIGVSQEISNFDDEPLYLNKLSSLQLCLVNQNSDLYSTYGCWSGELSVQKQKITRGRMVFEALNGYSSKTRNPFFLIKDGDSDFHHGNVYGFNLVYSGNFENSVEMDAFENMRIQVGISSTQFEKKLENGESFYTPMAVMTYSNEGINGMSDHFHRFVNECVIPREFYHQERLVAYNNWEATCMNFNERRIVSLMKQASKLGIELFVLDDGWFGNRNNDSAGLGDWTVNKKKLPSGLEGLAQTAEKYGMKFGIWMEPEMINEDSDLYRNHPEWVIHDIYHTPSKGRHQLTLDLTKTAVQNYIVDSVCNVLGSANISYLKWDCNRNISDYLNENGTFFFDYIVGLYSVLKRIRDKFPHVLIENCASGGNRFDLGMLSFFAQSWLSDDTDSYQRLYIQEGALLGYPLSVLSNHVSCKTSNQMLRYTSFDTKFDVACFGVLGYELDLDELSPVDISVISDQISYYKKNRKTLQWGKVYQSNLLMDGLEKEVQASLNDNHLIGLYQTIQKPNPKEKHLIAYGLQEDVLYQYKGRQESLPLRKFGGLVNTDLSLHLNPEGAILSMIEKRKDVKSEVDMGILSGGVFTSAGAVLSQEWSGVGFDERVRLMGDFSARLYHVGVYDSSISE